LIAGLKISSHDINISNSSLNSSVPTGIDLSSKIKDERKDSRRIDVSAIMPADR
jgi:hypothetical protein